MKKISLLIILVLNSILIKAQTIDKVFYEGDSFFTIDIKEFYDISFKLPIYAPNGRYIIFEGNRIPRYTFSVNNNAIDGHFQYFENEVLRQKGKYHNDTIWTFRFNKQNHLFKEGIWTYTLPYRDSCYNPVGIDFIWEKCENLWYANGNRKFVTTKNEKIWYYSNGEIKYNEFMLPNPSEDIIIQKSYDSLGNLISITETNGKLSLDYTMSDTIRFTPNFKSVKKPYLKKVEYINGVINRFTKESKKDVIVVEYDNLGEEINKKRIRKNNP